MYQHSRACVHGASVAIPFIIKIKAWKIQRTWGVQVLRYPNSFLGMEADRNVKVVGGDVAVL